MGRFGRFPNTTRLMLPADTLMHAVRKCAVAPINAPLFQHERLFWAKWVSNMLETAVLADSPATPKTLRKHLSAHAEALMAGAEEIRRAAIAREAAKQRKRRAFYRQRAIDAGEVWRGD